MLRLALFGTSADPPTIAHQAILEWLAQRFDQVVVWAADNPFKTHPTPLADRQAMLQLLIQAIQPIYPNIAVYPEFSHPRSLRTVEQVQQCWPAAVLTLVVGSDVLTKMSDWYQAETLFRQVNLLVVQRPDAPPDPADLAALRRKGATVAIADFVGPQVSSTAYREQGNTAGLIPAVAAYIQEKGLYAWLDTDRQTANPPMNSLTQFNQPSP